VKLFKKALINFPGIPYRLEFVGEFRGIKFYNDTCATTPEATLAALESFTEQPIILILGGKDKKLDYEKLGIAVGQIKKLKRLSCCSIPLTTPPRKYFLP